MPLHADAVTASGSVRAARAETALTRDEHVVLARSAEEARQLAAASFTCVAPMFMALRDCRQDGDQDGDERR